MKKLLLTAVIFITMMSSAFAQSQACDTHDNIVEYLAEIYGEARQSIGLRTGNRKLDYYCYKSRRTYVYRFVRTKFSVFR